MKRANEQVRAFSLVEVVLAIGVVSFAMLGIFALFSTMLQSNKEVAEEVEALSIAKALPAFLQSVNSTPSTPSQQGFPTVYGWVSSSSNPAPPGSPSGSGTVGPPLIYAYNVPATPGVNNAAGTAVLTTSPVTGSPSPAPSPATARQGKLFGIYLALSPNFPVGTFVHPTSANLPAIASYAEGALAVQVKIYSIPAIGLRPSATAVPILTYDLTVKR